MTKTRDEHEIELPTPDEVAEFGGPSGDAQGTTEGGAGGESPDALRRERDEFKDKFLRAQAECANISKRLHQQHAEAIKYAATHLARDVLNVLDSFERSEEGLKSAGADPAVIDGVQLIADQLMKVLRDHGVQPIEAVGAPFDPTRHEAIMQDYESDAPDGTVTAELVRGFTMHGRVLRPARVSVAAKRPEV